MRVFGCFLLFHMLFDFYFQSNKMAGEKEYSRIALAMHCLVYAAGAAATVALLFEASATAIAASFTVFALSHWIIDGSLRRAFAGLDLSPVGSFLADQVLHIIILLILSVLCCYLWAMRPIASNFLGARGAELSWISTLCFCGRPCSIVIAKVLQSLRNPGVEQSADTTTAHSGKWIGIFERLIVAALSLLNQYSAIAFIFTAKSIARFKQLESDKDFAEVYLLGSLASVFLAMASAILFSYLFSGTAC
jgi:hypothetical protein